MGAKRQNDYKWHNFRFFQKTNMEEKLVNEIDNEFQIVGPR